MFTSFEMYYSGMTQGFHVLLEFRTNSESFEGLFRAALYYCSWIALGTGWNKFVVLEDENSFGDPIYP